MLGGVAAVWWTQSASSDTETCASWGEYQSLENLMSLNQVQSLFDVDGWRSYEDLDEFRQSFRTCWNPAGTKIVVRFDANNGLSFDWFTAARG